MTTAEFVKRKLLLFKEKDWGVRDFLSFFTALSIVYYIGFRLVVNFYSEFFFVDDFPYSPIKEGLTPFFRSIVLDYIKVIYSSFLMGIVLTVLYIKLQFKISFWKLQGVISILLFITFAISQLGGYLELNSLVLILSECRYDGYKGQVNILLALMFLFLIPLFGVLFIEFNGRFLSKTIKKIGMFLIVAIIFNLFNNGVGEFAESKIIPFKTKRMMKYLERKYTLNTLTKNDFKRCVDIDEYLEMKKRRYSKMREH